MTPINVLVSAVRVDSIETSRFGEREPDIAAGRTMVEFETADHQTFEIDWTWRGEPPAPGTKLVLREDQ